ncbi:ABC transporter permease [Streptomyces sp. NPDC056296]|uniref:ABC transporter permease n=1 Tax=Streptomyces sp. NPDC056296 TaxID=3345775 RepID=UPI0035D612F0
MSTQTVGVKATERRAGRPGIADRRLWRYGGRWLVPVAILLLWQALHMILGAADVAAPGRTGVVLADYLGEWWPDLIVTVRSLAISFAVAAGIGVVGGFLLGLSEFWYRVVSPLLVVAYAVPKIVLYPVILMALGLSEEARIVFSLIHGVFPIMLLTATATTTIPQIRLRVADSYRLSLAQRLRLVVLPSIAPTVVASLRIGFGACFLGLILAEMFAAYNGLGFLITGYAVDSTTERLLALVLLITLLAFLVTYTIRLWEEGRARRLGLTNVIAG